MSQAKVGDIVRVTYRGRLADGTEFDASKDDTPLELILGEYCVLPAFEDAVVGLAPGETTTLAVAPSDAYGDYREDLLTEVPRTSLPADATVEVGAMLQLALSSGEQLDVTITEVQKKSVLVDGNHPLAGKELWYEIQLVEICKPA